MKILLFLKAGVLVATRNNGEVDSKRSHSLFTIGGSRICLLGNIAISQDP
jgi:hypothetical protein